METICDWLEGRLDADETARVATRVEQDRDLSARAEWLRRRLADQPQFRIATPPPDLRNKLEALFDQRESKFGVFKRYLAELVSDSWSGQPAAGMRGGISDDEARHLIFSCKLLDVTITIRRHPVHGYIGLKGQILAPDGLDPGLCSLELADETGQIHRCDSGDEGEFEFRNLSKGEHHLTINGPGYEVSTPAFTVH